MGPRAGVERVVRWTYCMDACSARERCSAGGVAHRLLRRRGVVVLRPDALAGAAVGRDVAVEAPLAARHRREQPRIGARRHAWMMVVQQGRDMAPACPGVAVAFFGGVVQQGRGGESASHAGVAVDGPAKTRRHRQRHRRAGVAVAFFGGESASGSWAGCSLSLCGAMDDQEEDQATFLSTRARAVERIVRAHQPGDVALLDARLERQHVRVEQVGPRHLPKVDTGGSV